MVAFNLDEFKSNFEGGAKQYLFYIKPNIPGGVITMEKSTYLVMTSQLPGRNIEEVIAPWQGMDYKYAGKSTWDAWECTFRVDRLAKIRTAFEKWSNQIHDPVTNIRTLPAAYVADQYAQLLDENGSPIVTYKLIDAWPSAMTAIDLDYAGTEGAQFSITFTYQYYTMEEGGNTAGL